MQIEEALPSLILPAVSIFDVGVDVPIPTFPLLPATSPFAFEVHHELANDVNKSAEVIVPSAILVEAICTGTEVVKSTLAVKV